MDKYKYSVTIFVATHPPLSAEANEIEDIFKRNRILFRQMRRSPTSITYITTINPSNALDPYISDNLSCIESFQVYQLDDTSPVPSISCKVYYSFLSIKIPSFSNHVVEPQDQAKILPPIERKQAEVTGPTRRPSPFRNIFASRPANSKRMSAPANAR